MVEATEDGCALRGNRDESQEKFLPVGVRRGKEREEE